MQVVILCGGKGLRLRPLSEDVPKPLMRVGDRPILEHIMRYYADFGHSSFILCLGYKGHKIKEYFRGTKEWDITFVNTGLESTKAQRLLMIRRYLINDTFLVSYGDDISNVDLKRLVTFHESHAGLATLTSVNASSQFGIIKIRDGKVAEFVEKPRLKEWINGGFFVFNRKIFDCIKAHDDLESGVLQRIARKGLLFAYKHRGFWACLNNYQDYVHLNEMWKNGNIAWRGKKLD